MPLSSPGRAAARSDAAQSRDPACRALRRWMLFRLTWLRVLAAYSPEPCCCLSPCSKARAQGKTGRRLAPEVPRVLKNAHGGGRQVCRSPGLPCAMVFTVSFVLSSGSDALLPPSPPAFARCADRSAATSPRGLGASYRAPGPHDFSVRAHLRWVLRGWRALTVKAMRGRCQRRVVPRPSPLTVARPAASSRADAVAATASRPASRDDRETPLVAGGTRDLYGRTEIL